MKDEKLSVFWFEMVEWCNAEILRLKTLSDNCMKNYQDSLKKESGKNE